MIELQQRKFSFEEEIEILNILSEHHTVFQTFFSISKPIFTEEIPTAAVGFNSSGKCIMMLINPKFWDSLNYYNKAFVIAHECLHIILNHGERGKHYKNAKNVNIAQDIVINEILVYGFGFNKFEIINWENFCFLETVFGLDLISEKNIELHKTFDYYLKIIESLSLNSNQKLVDCHQNEMKDFGLDGELSKEIQDLLDEANKNSNEMIDNLEENLSEKISDSEKYEFAKDLGEELSKSKEAGNSSLGNYIDIFNNKKQKKKGGWEKIVKKHVISLMKNEFVEKESWLTRDRKAMLLDDDLFIQGVFEEESREKQKYDLVFFLDASGSCLNYSKRFFKLLKSIPEDKFKISAYSFDTNVYEIDLNGDKIKGSGGTSFQVINNEVENITKIRKKHPDAIFVLSDGAGDRFTPSKPKLWHWILVPNSSTGFIPKESTCHNMKDFD